MASESQMKRMPGSVCRSVNSTAVPAYDAFCSAPVRCGKSACPGACQRARVLLLITSMPRVWIVVFCVEEGFLGAP